MTASPAPAPGADPVPPDGCQLRLLGHFDLAGAQVCALGNAEQRLLALIAVHSGALARWQAAQLLYPMPPTHARRRTFAPSCGGCSDAAPPSWMSPRLRSGWPPTCGWTSGPPGRPPAD